jgi:hypothetical protein
VDGSADSLTWDGNDEVDPVPTSWEMAVNAFSLFCVDLFRENAFLNSGYEDMIDVWKQALTLST